MWRVWRGLCRSAAQVGCVFLVEVGRGKLVYFAVGLCKGVPEVVEFVGVEERLCFFICRCLVCICVGRFWCHKGGCEG